MIESEILRSLMPLIIVNGCVILSLIPFTIVYFRKERDQEVLARMHKTFLGVYVREFWYWLSSPAISLFKLSGLTPNMVTGISLVFAFISGYYYYNGNIGLAGWMLVISSTLDILDGKLARETGLVTREGEFFDSCVDRYADGVVFLGIALYFRNDLWMLFFSIFALVGSEVVSYARAKGEIIGVSTKKGLMQRAERNFLLCFVSLLHPLIMVVLSRYGITAAYPMIILMTVMAVLTNYTAAVRMHALFNEIKKLKMV